MAVITFYDTSIIDDYQLTEGLRNTDHFWEYIREPISLDNLNPDSEVVSVFVTSNITRQIMERLPRLKLIAVRSTGFDNIDLDYARLRNITVVNVPTYGENTVAEHAFALLLAVVRNLIPSVDMTERGEFQSSRHVGIDLQGRTFGIIGLGSIGKHAAKIARGFGMKVLAYDPYPDESFAEENGVEIRSFRDVLSDSDIVSLHVPMTPTNYHLINEHTIDIMKRGAVLINTARGELVESRALIRALQDGKLRGAGLDTLEGEQFLDRSAVIGAISSNSTAPSSYEQATENFILLRMPTVVITKHVAFNTAEAIKRINDVTTKNIIDYWYGQTPNVVKQQSSSGKLVILRHAESEWNALGKWTGTTDVHITPKGIKDAAAMGQTLRDISFDYAYISQQVRTKETFEAFINGSGQLGLPFEASAAINERDYGVYTGMDKNSIQNIIGTEAFNELRRSWDGPVENGESLENVYQRTVPFYLRIVLPRLRHGQDILIVAHGNSIRSLVKYIENISDEDIGELEMIQNSALCYEVDSEGRARNKTVRQAEGVQDNPLEEVV